MGTNKLIDKIKSLFSKDRIFFVYLFSSMLVVVLFGGYFQKQKIENGQKKSVHNQLASIAELKIDNIADWYRDRLASTNAIGLNGALSWLVELTISKDDSINRNNLSFYLSVIKKEQNFAEVHVLNQNHDLIESTFGNKIIILPELESILSKAALSKTSLASDLYLAGDKGIPHLSFVCPLYNKSNKIIAFVVFEEDPERYLFPLIQKWPLPSETAETLLLRDDGDSIVYLNELRHAKGSSLKMKIDKSKVNIAAIQAVNGYVGIFEGLDYRNEEVVSYVNKIEGTPWFLVAKTDNNEIYKELRKSNKQFLGLLFFIILGLFFIMAYIYSQRQKKIYKSLWLSQEEYRTTLYSIGDAVITTNRYGSVTSLNPVAEQLTGWSEIAAKGLPIEHIFKIINEETRNIVDNPVEKVVKEGKIVGLANHTLLISKDGRETPIADSGAPIKNELGEITGVVLVFRDQTEEYSHRKIVDEQQRQLFTLMSNLSGMVYRCLNDEKWTMNFVSKGCYDLTGYETDELLNNVEIDYATIIYPADKDQVWNKVQEALDKKQAFELEYRIVKKDGCIRWVWEKGQGVYDKNNELVFLEGFINDITERKEDESALIEWERSLNEAQRMAKVGSWTYDINTQTGKWSKQMCEFFDFDVNAEAPALHDYLNYIHPEDIVLVKEMMESMMKGEIPELKEYRTNPRKCNLRILKPTYQFIRNENEEITTWAGTLTDITEIILYEEKINRTNELLQAVIDTIPDAIYIKDTEGRKIMANKADLVNIGANSEEEVIGKTDFELFPKHIAEGFWAVDKKVIETGEAMLDVEEDLVNENNVVKFLSTSKIPFRNEKGEIVGLIGIGHDITQRQKDEQEKIKLFTVLSQSPVSIVITNMKGDIEYVNPKFIEVTGYTYDEAIGNNPRMLKSGMQSDQFYKDMWSDLSSGKEWRGEFQNRKKSGEIYWENAIIAPIKNRKGEIINFVAVKEDITDKVDMHKELVLAKDKAEESDQLKTSFLANMSHEIRTPLNSILGFTNILTDSEDLSEEEKLEYSSIIQKSSEGLLQIINDIIDISSLETGQLKIVNSEFDANALVNLLYLEFTRRMKETNKVGVELIKMNSDYELKLETDFNRLNQIFVNLLTNAFKFTQSGRIEFGIESMDKNYVHFKVVDTGIGISKESQKFIFERFRQAETETTRQYGGNGLGLSIVKNLIELMGGEISVESEIDKGSTFQFKLPFKPPVK